MLQTYGRSAFNATVREDLCANLGGYYSLTGCITDNVNVLVENTIPPRTVWCLSCPGTWLKLVIKILLKKSKKAISLFKIKG